MVGMPGMSGAGMSGVSGTRGMDAGITGTATATTTGTTATTGTATGTPTTAGTTTTTAGTPTPASVAQPGFRATVPQGFNMSPGQTMWGTVTGQKGGFFTFQFGKFSLTAQSTLPFTVGQRIQVGFDGFKGNQANFQLLKTMDFSRMTQADLSTALSRMNQPPTDKAMTTAKGMVEFGIPLTKGNFSEVSRALNQLGRPVTTADMASCSFLKMNNIPLTPQNVQVMSNFIAQHPMLGSQIFELQNVIKREEKKVKDDQSKNIEEIGETGELGAVLGKYTVDPRETRAKMQKNLKNLARESGMEKMNLGMGMEEEDSWELLKASRLLRKEAPAMFGVTAGAVIRETAKKLEENLMAQQLINKGTPGSDLAFYYLQIPVRMENETVTVEARVKYYDDEEGKTVDPQNTQLEFTVTTENLGEMHLVLDVKKGTANLRVGTESREVSDWVERFLPALTRSLYGLGYKPGYLKAGSIEDIHRSPLVQKEDFSLLEKVNVQA